MTADIDMSNGRANFAFFGEREGIWHRLGQQVDPDRVHDIEYWMELSGAKFEVHKAPINYTAKLLDGTEQTMAFDNKVVTYRNDTGAALGAVSDNKYNIVQPAECYEFFEGFLSDNDLTLSTAGFLKGGRIVFVLANLGENYRFMLNGTNDVVQGYLRIQTSFDGSRSTTGVLTFIRQVCSNTEAAVESATKGQQYRTTHSQHFDAEALQAAVGLMGEQARVTVDVWESLANVQVTDAHARAYICEVLDIKVDDLNTYDDKGKCLVSKKLKNQVLAIGGLYKTGPGSDLPTAKGTAYGLLQAVTAYVDHQKGTRDIYGDGKATARMNSAWFGQGATMKLRAREMAQERFLIAA